MKEILKPIALTAGVILILGLFVNGVKSDRIKLGNLLPTASSTPKPKEDSTSKVKIADKEYLVEVADTESSRQKGLSQRDSLEEGKGMLFIFPSENIIPVFWMKDMRFSIDIIWINDGRIVKIDKNLPFPEDSTQDSDLTKYSPGGPIDYVLEINATESDKYKFKVGDSVSFEGI